MAERVCSACGEKKDLKGGMTCEKEHFICSKCKYSGWSKRTRCPICDTKLK